MGSSRDNFSGSPEPTRHGFPCPPETLSVPAHPVNHVTTRIERFFRSLGMVRASELPIE